MTHAARVSNGKAAALAPGKIRRRLQILPATRTPALEMSCSASIATNTGSSVVIIFLGRFSDFTVGSTELHFRDDNLPSSDSIELNLQGYYSTSPAQAESTVQHPRMSPAQEHCLQL